MQHVRRVSTGLWAGDKRQNVAAARARIARERFDSSKSRVPTGFSDIDGVLGRIRVTRVPTAFLASDDHEPAGLQGKLF